MSERPDSYFYMYTGDYLRDTMHLTTRQHGAYMLLLMHYYGKMKCLPLSEETLRTIARLSASEWKTDGPVVMAYFHKEEDGWHQVRADKEILKAVKRYDKAVNAAAAKHGRKHEPSTSQADSEHEPSTCLEGANPNPNPTHSSRNPLRGSRTHGGRRAAAHGQAAAQPAVQKDWADEIPEWASFKSTLHPTEWVAWFSKGHPNGSTASLVAETTFQRDEVAARYLPRLLSHFGEHFQLKLKTENHQ